MVTSKSIQEEKLEEIQNIIEMKVAHRRNINKRRAKWGYESNSTIGMGRRQLRNRFSSHTTLLYNFIRDSLEEMRHI